ncbi:MAG: amidohydrolase family protein [Proteobacteria bacterium]|nr:amidohydrolase family protein [Pseudomonadota bacterium]
MLLKTPLPALDDVAGEGVPPGMTPIVDAHVHLFPDGIFKAVWDWFDNHGWPIRYKLDSKKLLNFLRDQGIRHVVGLQYAHKASIAEGLNQYMLELCREFPGFLIGLATVFPGERNQEKILKTAFNQGLKGVKLHVHVQCFDMNSPELDPVYQCCSDSNKPLLMHAGKEPKSHAYKCDPHELCSIEKLEKVLVNYPKLKLCVPHLGVGELEEYRKLIEKHDNIWLDTAMALSNYFPNSRTPDLSKMRSDRVMYGSDFPNIPYAWDREIKLIEKMGVEKKALHKILYQNAKEFYGIDS